jgi:hypothetical protein
MRTTMSTWKHVRCCLAVVATTTLATSLARPSLVPAQAAPHAVAGSPDSATPRNGQHDFDFLNGSWKVHLERLLHPLTGSTTWVEYDGTAMAQPIMGGRAQLDQFQADAPATHQHIAGMTLRLYDPETRVWRLYYVDAKSGMLGLPPDVGRFDDNGRGEFYDYEVLNGEPILVRYLWTDITATSARFEQAFSPDGGQTWETNWIYTCTRVKE